MESPYTTWYSVATVGIIALLGIILVLRPILYKVIFALIYIALKYIIYPRIRILDYFGVHLSIVDILSATTFVAANVLCIAWQVESTKQISIRAASMLATNLILLLLGASTTADMLFISLATFKKYHILIAIVATIEALLHTSLELSLQSWQMSRQTVSGVVVSLSNYIPEKTNLYVGSSKPCYNYSDLC